MSIYKINSIKIFLVSGCAMALLACGSPPPPAMPPSVVDVVTVKSQPWHANLQVTGTVMALQGAMLKAEVPGRVTKVAFKPGDTVAQGDLLYDINPLRLAAQLKVSQAEAELEVENYKRALTLYAQHVISKADFDRAKSTAKSDLAKVEAAQAELDQVAVHAPFSGKVGLDLVQEGDYVSAGQPLVNLQQLDHLRIDFSVPEQYSDQIHVGDQVVVQPRDNGTTSYLGQVTAIDSAIDVGSRLLAVRAVINNVKQVLLPGTFVNAVLYYGPQLSVIAIPQVAVVNADKGNKVYRVVNGKAVATPVKEGLRFSDQVIINSGLKVNDVVVVAGQLKVQDGAPVSVTESHG